MKNFKNYGFNLIEVGPDEWAVEVIDIETFGGSFKEVIIFATMRLGLKLDQLETGVQCMIEFEHNTAHFGSAGYFQYSFDNKFEEYRRVV